MEKMVMKNNHIEYKALEDVRWAAGIISKKRIAIIEGLQQINDVLDAARFLKKLPVDIEATKKDIRESLKAIDERTPLLEPKVDLKNKLESQVNEGEKQLHLLKEEVEQLEIRVERIEAKTSAVTDLKTKTSRLKTERDSILLNSQKLTPIILYLQEEVASIQSKVTTDIEEIKKLESEKQILNMGLVACRKKIRELEQSEAKKFLEKTLLENKQLAEEIDRLRIDVKQAEHLATVEDDIDALKTKIAQVRGALEAHQKENSVLVGEIENAKTGLETIKNEFSEFHKKVGGYENQPKLLKELKKKELELKTQGTQYAEKSHAMQAEQQHLMSAMELLNVELSSYKEAIQQINSM